MQGVSSRARGKSFPIGRGKDEPAHREPAHREPAHREPAHREPAHREPAHREPAHREPAHREPAHREPALRVHSGLDMNLRLRYLVLTAAVGLLAAVMVGGSLVSLIPNVLLAGAAFSAGYVALLTVTVVMAIQAGRKAAALYEDPRYGALAGMSIGPWVGAGAVLAQVIFAIFARSAWQAEIRAGLVVVFCLVYVAVAVIAARISGRQAALPPDVEEEA